MNKTNKEHNNSSYISIIAIILILFIFAYLIYMLYQNSTILNSNDISSNITSLENTQEINSNSEENVIAQKEVKYEEIEIASYTSTLYDNEESRIYNIQKACSMLQH